MSKRSWWCMVGLVCFLLGLLVGQQVSFVHAQGAKAKAASWKYDFDMPVRQGGNTDWDKARKFGVEVYLDQNSNTLVYISETGSIAAVPNR